jgi:hypothetical protein
MAIITRPTKYKLQNIVIYYYCTFSPSTCFYYVISHKAFKRVYDIYPCPHEMIIGVRRKTQ